jgi:acetyl-CoA carboxylase biotin carboxyl carrier protein
MIDFKILEKLLELLNSSNAGSIEVRKNLWSTTIRVSKDTAFGSSGPVTWRVSAPGGNPAPSAPSASLPGETADAGTVEPAADLMEMKSPMVGTFYAQPEPGADPYVRVGSRVSVGQTLCIIEAMKIMNPIDAEIAGVIKEVCVQDAQPVEFGQVLFRMDPNG